MHSRDVIEPRLDPAAGFLIIICGVKKTHLNWSLQVYKEARQQTKLWAKENPGPP